MNGNDYNGNNNGGRRERHLNSVGPLGNRTPEQLLEELFRFFRGGGKNGGGGGNNFIERKSFLPVVFLVILLIVGALTSFYTVDVSEEGVVTRFGRYYTTAPSGLHFKMPFWIDRVIKVPSKVLLQEEFGFRSQGGTEGRTSYTKTAFREESLMLTGDLNVADVEWIVQYRISDPWKFLFHARNVRKNIRDVTMSIMRRVIGDRLVGDVLTVGRVEIADEAKVLVQAVLDKYDMGISISAIMLQDVNPPEAVKSAFNEVNAAKQEQEKAINNAEQEYNKVIPEARGKAEQLIANSEGYALSLINRAEGDANKFMNVQRQYRLAPDVTRRRLYIESMEKVFGNLDKIIIVDSNIKGILPLYSGMESLSGSTRSRRTTNPATEGAPSE